MTDGRRPRPERLRVDGEAAPENVPPDSAPRFSWRLDEESRQTAYRVQVGRDRQRLQDGEADVWDSGRVDGAASVAVPYDGVPLAADATYHWRVQVWTTNGGKAINGDDEAPTAWSRPRSFATALGADHEWDGEWITRQPGPGDTNGYRSQWHPAGEDAEEWVTVDLGETRAFETVALHPASPFDGVETPDGMTLSALFSEAADEGHPVTARGPDGFGFPTRYRVEVADDSEFDDPAVVVDRTGADQPNPGAETRTHDVDATGRYVRVVATDLYEVGPASGGPAYHSTKVEMVREERRAWQAFALAALRVRDGEGRDLARGRPVTAATSVETDTWGRAHIVNGADESQTAATAPLLRTEVDLDGEVERARLHAATPGWGETYVNGEKVGDAVLDPAWTCYDSRVLYATHDVTDLLSAGTNALGLWLGRGWFAKNDYDWTGFGSPRARLHLTVEYADGRTRTVGTDGSWRAHESPVVENDVYDGEVYDVRREQPGWAEPDFDDGGWDDAAVVDGPGGDMRPQRLPPAREVRTFEPASVTERDDGGYVVDFGQNLTGWVELTVRGAERGRVVELAHAEALDDDDLSMVDLRSADATDAYVAGGDAVETYAPRFTYHGFRYARVDGYPGDLDPADLVATVVHTDVSPRGEFACSNADLEAVQHAAEWSLRGNTVAVPTGCAQRDERTGWTGDAQLSARALLYNFDAGAFHEKWMRDHDDEQSHHGYVGDTVPFVHGTVPGDPSWTLTRVLIPWYRYQFDGDRRALADHYEGMVRHVDYWDSLTEDGYLPAEYGNYGDWLAFENLAGETNVGEPVDLFNTASHYRALRTVADAADALGNDADARRYRERAATVRTAFTDRFFDPETATYEPGTQAAQAVPLSHGLVPEGHEEAVVAGLVERVHDAGDRLLTGFLGTRALLRALSDHGHADLAYELVSQPERPGWVYMVRNGATTLWERWNSDDEVGSGMNSFNHHQFAYVSEWFYWALAGLRLENCADGNYTVAPRTPAGLDRAEGAVETPRGELASQWERTDDDGLALDVTVPWNAAATVRVPAAGATAVTADGEAVWTASAGVASGTDHPDGVRDVEAVDGAVRVTVGAGDHAFGVER